LLACRFYQVEIFPAQFVPGAGFSKELDFKKLELLGSWNARGAGAAGAGIPSGPGPPLLLYHKLDIMSRKILFNLFKIILFYLFYFNLILI
jgi:hypothetical protein